MWRWRTRLWGLWRFTQRFSFKQSWSLSRFSFQNKEATLILIPNSNTNTPIVATKSLFKRYWKKIFRKNSMIQKSMLHLELGNQMKQGSQFLCYSQIVISFWHCPKYFVCMYNSQRIFPIDFCLTFLIPKIHHIRLSFV